MLLKANLGLAIIFFVISLIFYFIPGIDIKISSYFFVSSKGFIYENNKTVQQIFNIVPVITQSYYICMAILLVLYKFKHSFAETFKSKIMAVLFCSIIGPGLIINYALKDHFGRARPKQIIELNGSKNFSKVYKISNQCKKNCSFSSGHAAVGFNLTTLAYMSPFWLQPYVIVVGLFSGLAIGLGRIVQGGHFASDIVVSGWIIFAVNALIFYLWDKFKRKTSN